MKRLAQYYCANLFIQESNRFPRRLSSLYKLYSTPIHKPHSQINCNVQNATIAMIPNRETKCIHSVIAFSVLLTLLTLSAATPFCCDMKFDCLNGQRESKGEYIIGATLPREERDICTRQGRANWCVAKWTNNNWYCTSPGNFIDQLDDYKKNCKGGIFPTRGGKKEPCCRTGGLLEQQCKVALNKLKKKC